jgi:hypothetical protein
LRTKNRKKTRILEKKIFLFVYYFIPGVGKHFGSRLRVFNGGPFGVSL